MAFVLYAGLIVAVVGAIAWSGWLSFVGLLIMAAAVWGIDR